MRAANLNLTLQPLKLLDYLLERPAQAALVSSQGAIVVNVPDPARYALHKGLVAGERPISERAKATKDLIQAASMMSYMQEAMPKDVLQPAWEDLAGRGPNWVKRFQRSLGILGRTYP